MTYPVYLGHFDSAWMDAHLLSHVSLFATARIVACQVLLSMEFSRQKYWSGLPCHLPGYLPPPGPEPASPVLAGRFFTTEPPLAQLKGSLF